MIRMTTGSFPFRVWKTNHGGLVREEHTNGYVRSYCFVTPPPGKTSLGVGSRMPVTWMLCP
jgi:hypothetical protein